MCLKRILFAAFGVADHSKVPEYSRERVSLYAFLRQNTRGFFQTASSRKSAARAGVSARNTGPKGISSSSLPKP